MRNIHDRVEGVALLDNGNTLQSFWLKNGWL